MKTYADRLRWGMERAGVGQSELARRLIQAGTKVTQQSIAHLLTPDAQRSGFTTQIARELGLNPDWLAAETGPRLADGTDGDSMTPPMPTAQTVTPNARLSSDSPRLFRDWGLPKDVPVLGTATAGRDVDFWLNGETIDYVRRPPSIQGATKVFAIFTVGDSMMPWRQPGELAYLNPGREPRIGDHVVVELLSEREEDQSAGALLKRLIGRTKTQLRLAQYNPPKDDIIVPFSRVRRIHRVLEWSELLGM